MQVPGETPRMETVRVHAQRALPRVCAAATTATSWQPVMLAKAVGRCRSKYSMVLQRHHHVTLCNAANRCTPVPCLRKQLCNCTLPFLCIWDQSGAKLVSLAAAARLSTVSFSSAQSFYDQSRQFIHHYVRYNHIIIDATKRVAFTHLLQQLEQFAAHEVAFQSRIHPLLCQQQSVVPFCHFYACEL